MPVNEFHESSNFNRPPRIQPPRLKPQDFIILSPPRTSAGSEQNWLVSLLPVLSLVALAIFSIFQLATNSGSSSPAAAMQLMVLAIVSIVGAVIGPRLRQRYQNLRDHESKVDYLIMLDNQRTRLQAARDAQLGALDYDYPASEVWFHAVLSQSPRIWERRIDEPDFMNVRIGLGKVPSVVNVNTTNTDLEGELATQALQLRDEYRYLPNAPFIINLPKDIGISVFGKPTLVMKAIRAALCQLAATHAPQELQIYLVAPLNHYDQWQWMSWLPHTSRDYQGASFDLMSFNPEVTRQLMGKLGQIIDERKLRNVAQSLPHILLVVDDPHLLEDEAIFSTLLKEGNQHGASVICISSSYETSPSDCRAIIEFVDEKRFIYSHIGLGGDSFVGSHVDTVSLQDAEQMARGLASISLYEIGESGRIPRKVDFLEMMNMSDISNLQQVIKGKWRRGTERELPFPINIGRESLVATTQLKLDEQNHGPHGVLAGTTGAGKSELLQTLVTALALEHDPRYVSFLLVDFKGGATFEVFNALPHTVGVVTDLDREGIERTLKALNSEIGSREAFLHQKEVRNVSEYYRKFVRQYADIESPSFEPLPHLFVIVDELAQLAKQMPEFIQELVRIAQIGRSLGVHLILGTQSPMDVITEEMNANLQFRICLRVQNIEASRAMLRRPDAAYLPSDWRGRAYLQVGQQDVFTQFQTAYVGDTYGRTVNDSHNICEILEPNGHSRSILASFDLDSGAPTSGLDLENQTDYVTIAKVVSDTIITYANENNVPKAKPILLAPLPKQLDINTIFNEHEIKGGWNGTDWAPVTVTNGETQTQINPGRTPVGLLDDVENRVQAPLWINFEVADPAFYYGHVMILGMPGSGKTTFLRTLAVSLAQTHSPEKLHLYFISFSATELNDLGDLPHANGVIQGNASARVNKLFARLLMLLRERQNAVDHGQAFPLIIVFIDQYEPFRDAYRETNHDDFEAVISEGRTFGIYMVFTANTPGAVPERIRSLVPQRIVFRLNESIDYLTAVGQPFNSDELTPKGRCLWRHKPLFLCQIGIFASGEGDTVGQRERNGVRQKVLEIRSQHASHDNGKLENYGPRPIEALATNYPLKTSVLSTHSEQSVVTPLGLIDDDEIHPFNLNWLEAGPNFVIVGPSGSGKSNILRASVLSAASLYPPSKISFVLVDFGRNHDLTDLADLKHTLEYVRNVKDLSQTLQRLMADSPRELVGSDDTKRAIAIIIDDFEQLSDELQAYSPQLVNQLLELIRQQHTQFQLYVWVANHIDQAGDPITRRLLLNGSVFGLVTRDSLQQVTKRSVRLPATVLPTGRAYSQVRNRIEVVQFAMVDPQEHYIETINSRIWVNEAQVTWGDLNANVSPSIPDRSSFARTNFPTSDDLDSDIDVTGLIDDLL